MRWSYLKLFYRVVKAGSITAAAEKMNLSQPALSRSISKLEREMGFALLIRRKNGVIPTPEGQQLYDHAKKMADCAKIALHELTGDTTRIRGPLKVVTFPILASGWVMYYLRGFQTKYPYVRTLLHSDENNFIGEQADVHISLLQPSGNDYRQFYLATIRTRLYASKAYLKKFGIPSSVEDLDHHRLLAFLPPEHLSYLNINWALKLGKEKGSYRKAYMEFDMLPCLLRAAKESMGIVELPSGYPAAEGVDLVEILPSLEGTSTDLYFIVHKDKEKLPKIKALLEFIKEAQLPEDMVLVEDIEAKGGKDFLLTYVESYDLSV